MALAAAMVGTLLAAALAPLTAADGVPGTPATFHTEATWSVSVKCSDLYTCPRDYPICCASPIYCVPAGRKCCQSGSGNVQTSCALDEQCCAWPDSATCCRPGSTCAGVGVTNATCRADPCTRHRDQGGCLAGNGAASSSPVCQWCCITGRCSARAITGPYGPNSHGVCPFQTTPIMDQARTCPEPRCNNARSCLECTTPQAGDEHGCTWDLLRQTCLTKQQAENVLSYDALQYSTTSGADLCPLAGPGGRGLYLTGNHLVPILACAAAMSVFGLCLIGTFGLAVFVQRRRRQRAAAPDAAAAPDHDAPPVRARFDTPTDRPSCCLCLDRHDAPVVALHVPCGHGFCSEHAAGRLRGKGIVGRLRGTDDLENAVCGKCRGVVSGVVDFTRVPT